MSAILQSAAVGTHLYACGLAGFIEHVCASEAQAGMPSDHVHFERFLPVNELSANNSFEVRLASRGRPFPIPVNQSIEPALQKNGVGLITSFNPGIWGACLTRVIEGMPEHRDHYLTPEEQSANDQLTPCCSCSRTTVLVLDLLALKKKLP